MGLSINYSGSIKDCALIEPLIVEVEDICKSLGWGYHIFRQKEFATVKNDIDYTPHYLSGIMFNASEKCEPVSLCFLPNKKMTALINLLAKDVYEEPEWIYLISTKTQFAGPDVHIAIIKLLRHVRDKYLENFKMNDEGLYWETNDEKTLLDQFERYNFVLDSFAGALSNVETRPGETADSLADKIEKVFAEIHKKFNS